MPQVSFKRLHPGVTEVRVRLKSAKDEALFHLTSDEHVDNKQCATGLLKQHLQEASERGAWWLNNGDLMCLMQGKYDPRRDRSGLREEFRGNDYLDAVHRYTHELVSPHAHRLIELGQGNHESKILQHCQTDMVERLVGSLNMEHGTSILKGGYGGYVLFRMQYGTQRKTIVMYRHHGSGRGGGVNKATNVVARKATWIIDADLIWTGHTHDSWVVDHPRQRISIPGRITYDVQTHFKTPGYLCGPMYNEGGWVVEKDFPPTVLGSVMLKLGFSNQLDGRTGIPKGFTKKIEQMQ